MLQDERSVLGDEKVQIILAGAVEVAAAEDQAIIVGVIARLLEPERRLEVVLAIDRVGGIPHDRCRAGTHGERTSHRLECDVGHIVRICGVGAAVDS